MTDSIERLFPISPAGSSLPGTPPALTNDEQVSAQHRPGVPPIDPLMLQRILDRHRPRPADNDMDTIFEREARGYAALIGIIAAFTLLLGIVAWVALP